MRHKTRSIASLAAAGVLGLVAVTGSMGPAQAAAPTGRALGLSGDRRTLMVFNLSATKRETVISSVKGLTDEDTKLVGIDHRIQDSNSTVSATVAACTRSTPPAELARWRSTRI